MRARRLFALLIAAQAAHSIEEYVQRLYDVLPPARFISSLVSADLAVGFAVANVALVGLGIWCYLTRVRPGRTSASAWAWAWSVLEAANGMGHLLLAWSSGGYFPGAWTAPLLLGVAAALGATLLRERATAGTVR
jgi:hypothetical protein